MVGFGTLRRRMSADVSYCFCSEPAAMVFPNAATFEDGNDLA